MEEISVSEKHLCKLMGAVIEMRHWQRQYFAHRQDGDKRRAMATESRVDRICLQLKMLGYKATIDTDEQTKLF